MRLYKSSTQLLGRSTPALTLGSDQGDDESNNLSEQPSWDDDGLPTYLMSAETKLTSTSLTARNDQVENRIDRMTVWIQNVESSFIYSCIFDTRETLTVFLPNDNRGRRRSPPELRCLDLSWPRPCSSHRPHVPPLLVQPFTWRTCSAQDSGCKPDLCERVRPGGVWQPELCGVLDGQECSVYVASPQPFVPQHDELPGAHPTNDPIGGAKWFC